MVMPPTVFAFAARGTVASRDSLICVPVKVLLINFRPAIEWSAIELPLIVTVAYAVPPMATNRAKLATINAGDGRSRIGMVVLRSWRAEPDPGQNSDDP